MDKNICNLNKKKQDNRKLKFTIKFNKIRNESAPKKKEIKINKKQIETKQKLNDMFKNKFDKKKYNEDKIEIDDVINLDKTSFSNDELKNKISNIINHVEKIEKKDEKRKIYNIIYHAYEKFGELQYFEDMIEKIEKLETTSISLVQQIYDDMKKTIENEKKFTLSDYENEYHGLLDKDDKPVNQDNNELLHNAKMRGGEFDKEFEEFKNNKVSNEEYKSPEITIKITQENGVNWCLLCCLLTVALNTGEFKDSFLKLRNKKYQFKSKYNKDEFTQHIFRTLNFNKRILIQSKTKKHELCEYGRGFNAKYLDEIIERLKLNIKVVEKGAFPYPAGFSFSNGVDNDLCKKYIFYKFAKWANKVGRGRYIILHAKIINGNTNHYVILNYINSEGMKFWDPQENKDISDLEIKEEEVTGGRKIFRAFCNTLGDSSWFLGYIVLE